MESSHAVGLDPVAHHVVELEAENARLHAENEQLRREREILKRTLSIVTELPDEMALESEMA
jgi:cell division protein FtsB